MLFQIPGCVQDRRLDIVQTREDISDRIAYDDIRSAWLGEDFDRGVRDVGVRTLRLQAGTFMNDLGTYRLYAYTGVPVCIDVRTDKGHVVFNAASDGATRALYEQLTERLPDVP